MKSQTLPFLLALCLTAVSISVSAQGVAINNSNNPANPTAILDISSDSKGVLVPRMETSVRENILNPAQGLLVYDKDTRSFWFYDGGWKEVAVGGSVIGPALGDLAGNYPNPSVVGLQGLAIAPGVPADKQVLKWDMIAGNWKGRNDSLFLPYNVASNNASSLFGITNTSGVGGSIAIKGKMSNAGSGITPAFSMGVWGDNSNGVGVIGTSNSGIGTYGFSAANHGVYGFSTAMGLAGVYGTSSAGSGIGVLGEVSGIGAGIYGKSSGALGFAGNFVTTDANNTDACIQGTNLGKGHVLKLTNTANANSPAIRIENYGSQASILANNYDQNSFLSAMHINNGGLGTGFYANNQNASSDAAAIFGYHFGPGKAFEGKSQLGITAYFHNDNVDNLNEVLKVNQVSRGTSAVFRKVNTTGSISDIHDPCVFINNTSKGSALKIESLHSPSANSAIDVDYSGDAFGIKVNSLKGGILVSSSAPAGGSGIFSQNFNQGYAIKGVTSTNSDGSIVGENQSNIGIGVKGIGTGSWGVGVQGMNASTNYSVGAVTGINSAPVQGVGVFGEATGTEGIGMYGVSHGANSAGIYGLNDNGGPAISGSGSGSTPVGVIGTAYFNSGTQGVGVLGQNFGSGCGVIGVSGDNGSGIKGNGGTATFSHAGLFEISNANNTGEAVLITNEGTGKSLNIITSNNSNSSNAIMVTKAGSGDFITFEAINGDNKIRFDNTGKGFFNGGTQNSGADIAESFDVENEIDAYEPGDVLVISLTEDRTVTKSSSPYSTLVAGVYATKPGVLLTENEIESDLSDEVPMGVVGVIPTKVCIEEGSITRGDLLVTSSIPGVAMKADLDKVKLGQVIGKALENYDGNEVGKIKVLVNVK